MGNERGRGTRIAFSLTGGGAQYLTMDRSFQRTLEAIKPVAGMELFCFVSIDGGDYSGLLGQNVAKRFGRIACEIAGLAMERLVEADCPYGEHFANARRAHIARSAGFMTQASFMVAPFYPFIDFDKAAQSSLGRWLVNEKKVHGGNHYGPIRDREHVLWTMARVIHSCLLPDLNDQVRGVQMYYYAVAHCDDFRKQIAIAEKTVATCLGDLFHPRLGNCFGDMMDAAC